MKDAVLSSLLKKLSLDFETLSNFGPVSNLKFSSKVIEKVAAMSLTDYSCDNDLGPVVRRPISASPGVKFNLGFFFLCVKAFSRIIFFAIFRASNHQLVDKKN